MPPPLPLPLYGRVAAEGAVGERQRAEVKDAAAVAVGRVAAEDAVGEGHRARVVDHAAAVAALAELPLKMQSVRVIMP